ncbi:hypothetical protein Sjap_011085 [Stephania japonica]|uniref:Uncharacterized protein n=1 Tax=Stephania japonica TaxID=461633 RepID=A0AAP0P4R0_9MAGN
MDRGDEPGGGGLRTLRTCSGSEAASRDVAIWRMSGHQPGNGVDARGGPPLLSRPWREGGEGCFPVTPPLPLFPPRRPAREAATLWPAAGDPLRRVKATEGEGGRGRGGEHKLPSMTVDGGKMNFPPTS